MRDFIGRQENLFIATADKHGECDCSARFGRPGFVRVLNDNYLIFPEYRGNGVMASMGNILENPHIGMIFVDFFESTVGLHVNGKARIIEHEKLLDYGSDLPRDVIDEINTEGNRRPERWIMVEVEEAYIHCSKHIPLMKKLDKKIDWGTDSAIAKRSDFFDLENISLYDRIGGDTAIDVVLDKFYRKILMDDSIKHFFDDINITVQLGEQKNFLKMVFGGFPKGQYSMADLRASHQRLVAKGLNDKHIACVMKHLKDTLQELDVPENEIQTMMETLETMRDDVVNR